MRLFQILGIVVLVTAQSRLIHGQLINRPVLGAAAGMGNCTVSLNSNWGGFSNQASLAYQREYWIGVHHENRFMLAELGSSMLGVAIPVKPGTFGINVSHFGFTGYSISSGGLGYGMFLGKRFTAGVGFAFSRMQLPAEYRSANTFTVEGGIHYMPTSKLTFGFYVFNPTNSNFDDLSDFPMLMGLGITYFPSDRLMLVAQVDDDTQRAPTVRCGLEFRVIERTALRLGYSPASPEGITIGIGLPIKNFDVDLNLCHHQILGFTPSLSISYLFTKKEAVTQ